MNYYEVLADDKLFPDRWFLSDPLTIAREELDAREFRYGRPYTGPIPVLVPIGQEGRRVGFNLGAFDMPIVSKQIANILGKLAGPDIQRFPVQVGDDVGADYEIINAVQQKQCVDEPRSGVRKWGPEDGRPDKIGQYREFMQLVIDPARTDGSHVFRIWGSLVELIVSEEVQKAVDGISDLGIVFNPVSGAED